MPYYAEAPNPPWGGDVITINQYDGNGNPLSVTTDGVVTTYTYNSDGTPATQTRNGVTLTYAYSGGQLQSVS